MEDKVNNSFVAPKPNDLLDLKSTPRKRNKIAPRKIVCLTLDMLAKMKKIYTCEDVTMINPMENTND